MSVDRKSIHVRIPPEWHSKLSVMADFHDKDIADLAARILEKGIVAEFHDFSLTVEKMNRLGISGNGGE